MHISTDNGEITITTGDLILCLPRVIGAGIFITDAVIYAGLVLTANDIARIQGRFIVATREWAQKRDHVFQTSDHLRIMCASYAQFIWHVVDDRTMAEMHEFMRKLW